jgi:hypothetical protein
VPAE